MNPIDGTLAEVIIFGGMGLPDALCVADPPLSARVEEAGKRKVP